MIEPDFGIQNFPYIHILPYELYFALIAGEIHVSLESETNLRPIEPFRQDFFFPWTLYLNRIKHYNNSKISHMWHSFALATEGSGCGVYVRYHVVKEFPLDSFKLDCSLSYFWILLYFVWNVNLNATHPRLQAQQSVKLFIHVWTLISTYICMYAYVYIWILTTCVQGAVHFCFNATWP